VLPTNQEGVLTAPVEIEECQTLYAALGGDFAWRLLAYFALVLGAVNTAVRNKGRRNSVLFPGRVL
jgi:apolipoprotein N-acyltransferase